MIKAILFDLDGVLVDSLKANYLHLKAVAKKFGKKISFKEYKKTFWGMHFYDQLKILFGKIPEEKKEEITNYYIKISSNFVKKQRVYPEVKNVLRFLKKKYKIGLVTSTLKKIAENQLRHASIKKFFDIIIHGESVKNPKPAPDAILLACKKLKIKPEEAIFVGDNFQDVEAGKKAGCFMIAIKTTSSEEELKNADKIINNLKDLVKVVELCRKN